MKKNSKLRLSRQPWARYKGSSGVSRSRWFAGESPSDSRTDRGKPEVGKPSKASLITNKAAESAATSNPIYLEFPASVQPLITSTS
ncbi:hypothetical protein ACP6JB_003663 [Aspergillus fumigatus]